MIAVLILIFIIRNYLILVDDVYNEAGIFLKTSTLNNRNNNFNEDVEKDVRHIEESEDESLEKSLSADASKKKYTWHPLIEDLKKQ